MIRVNSSTIHLIAFSLVLVGALNWGLVALLGVNLVNLVFGSMPLLEKVVYLVVAASAVYELLTHQARCKDCGKMMAKK